MRTVLIGAVESTRVALETLVGLGEAPVALFTLPLAKAARHSDYVHLHPTASALGIDVVEVTNVNSPESLREVRSYRPDYIFVIGWSQICGAELLKSPSLGAIGYHPAPLPENRGRAVIPWTILQHRSETGSTLFWLDEGVDSGDIMLQARIRVEPNERAHTLYQKHLTALRELLTQAVLMLRVQNRQRVPQDHSKATYCAKRCGDDGLIDWNMPAEAVWTLIRAVTNPYPGAFTFSQGRKIIIWEAAYVGGGPYWGLPGQVQAFQGDGTLVQCGDGNHILIEKLECEGEKVIDARAVLRIHEKLGALSVPA